MTLPLQPTEALLDDLWLDLMDMCSLAGVSEPWLRERLGQGLLSARTLSVHDEWHFDGADLKRVRRMACLERDFDAVPELAALVADLEDELAALRTRLCRLGAA